MPGQRCGRQTTVAVPPLSTRFGTRFSSTRASSTRERQCVVHAGITLPVTVPGTATTHGVHGLVRQPEPGATSARCPVWPCLVTSIFPLEDHRPARRLQTAVPPPALQRVQPREPERDPTPASDCGGMPAPFRVRWVPSSTGPRCAACSSAARSLSKLQQPGGMASQRSPSLRLSRSGVSQVTHTQGRKLIREHLLDVCNSG